MAPKKSAAKKPAIDLFDAPSPAGSYVTLKLRPEFLQQFEESDVQINQIVRSQIWAERAERYVPSPRSSPLEPPEMETRSAWDRNRANPHRASLSSAHGSLSLYPTEGITNKLVPKNGISMPKGKPKANSTALRRQPTATQKTRAKKVKFALSVETLDESQSSADTSEHEVSPASDTDKENKMTEKPKLKLKLSSVSGAPSAPPQTPVPESATRTPSIKLNLARGSIEGIVRPPVESPAPIVPDSATKKRKKKATVSIQEKPATQHGAPNPLRRLTLTNIKTPQTPITPSGIKLKTKGKIPKRPLGVGFDSELDEREADPVILEGFILRMQPGEDCNYVRSSIETGKIGVHAMQGGAPVHIRWLDTQGRRGILSVRSNMYACSMVDLPCIIEGMKSWDKKGFIKSLDISQMLLVLGPCKNDDEARNYRLPDDVNPHNYQYAHGITAPMKWVRKRRFARTKRVRIDDIEAIDRRVAAMLEADRKSKRPVEVQVLDHDPRLNEPQYSGSGTEDEEEESEGEEDDQLEAKDYFTHQSSGSAGLVETPGDVEMAEDIDDGEVNDFERMLNEADEDAAMNTDATPARDPSHLAPDTAGDSSFAVTSTSASPSADTGTPAVTADTPGAATTDDDDEDDDDDDADRDAEGEEDDEDEEEKSDDEKDDDENVQQVKERIGDLEERITEQMELLKRTTNVILRRKIAGKIGDLKGDVGVLRRSIGLSAGEEGGDGDGEDGE